jgi:hypothetical protein
MVATWEQRRPIMRIYLITELFRFTRAELFALHAEILAALSALPEDSADRQVALNNLNAIRAALLRRGPAP